MQKNPGFPLLAGNWKNLIQLLAESVDTAPLPRVWKPRLVLLTPPITATLVILVKNPGPCRPPFFIYYKNKKKKYLFTKKKYILQGPAGGIVGR